MKNVAREAGAAHTTRLAARVLQAFLTVLLASAAMAGDFRLLRVDPTTVRSATTDVAGDVQMEFSANGKLHALKLSPQRDLGTWSAALAGKAAAYSGTVNGMAGTWASVTRIGKEWSGIWYDGGEYYGIDNAGALAEVNDDAARLDPAQLLVYRLRDVLWQENTLEGDTRWTALSGDDLVAELRADAKLQQPGDATRRLSLAIAADRQLALRYGNDTEAVLLAQVNMIDGLFTSQVGVRVLAHSVSVFNLATEGPFTAVTEPDAMLAEVSDWRIDSPQQRTAGLTHLFTGRNIDGRVVGMAYVNSVCSRRYAASLSESNTAVSFSALIAAHEIGHSFGAPHDGESGSACATTAQDFLMAPRVNGSQLFSACSLAQMKPKVESASCLTSTWLPAGGVSSYERPSLEGGGGGALGGWQLGALGLLLAARVLRFVRRAQPRANQSAR